jgi:hypothetical protein
MSTMSLGFAGGVGSFEARFDFRTQPIEEKKLTIVSIIIGRRFTVFIQWPHEMREARISDWIRGLNGKSKMSQTVLTRKKITHRYARSTSQFFAFRQGAISLPKLFETFFGEPQV